MTPGLKRIILGLVFLSILVAVSGIIVFRSFFSDWYFPFFPFLIIIFLLINSAFFYFFYNALGKTNNQFIRSFMLSTVIKLMIYLILILTYVLACPKTAISFSVTLSVLYIIYTAYDLFVMLTLLKRKKEKNILPN